jgi:hypothetical protein
MTKCLNVISFDSFFPPFSLQAVVVSSDLMNDGAALLRYLASITQEDVQMRQRKMEQLAVSVVHICYSAISRSA